MKVEGPDASDRARFGRDEGYCPECGASVWDDAPVCPKCGVFIGGQTLARPPMIRALEKRGKIVLVIVLILIISGVMALL